MEIKTSNKFNRYFAIFGLVGLFSLIAYAWTNIFNETKALNECSVVTKATIYKKSHKGTRYYRFMANGKWYKWRSITSWDLEIGDVIYIRYSCSNPKYSEEISTGEKPYFLEKDSLILPDGIKNQSTFYKNPFRLK